MTTLKEYKAMMEGATDAVAFVCRTLGWLEVVPPYGDKVDRTKECDKAIIECGKIRDALNKHTELIRVVELAEDALNSVVDDYDDKGHGAVLVNALSEIRKLRGE